MLEFYASTFIEKSAKLTAWEKTAGESSRETLVLPQLAVQLYADINIFGTLCSRHGFKSAALQCVRFAQKLQESQMQITCGYAREALAGLRTRIEDDLKTETFFHVTSNEAELFNKPTKGWEQATGRFGKIRHDVEESSKCFALGRYAASVFHILLVAEFGVIEAARFFGVEGDKPGWGSLERLQRIRDKKWVDKTPTEQEHAEFLKNLLPLAIAIKDSWRHKISHVDNKLEWMETDFSPEVASEIISATRGFMRRLAMEMP